MPSPDRNNALRGLQLLHGYLEEAKESGQSEYTFTFAGEDLLQLRAFCSELLPLLGSVSQSVQRDQLLSDLVVLRVLVERAVAQTK